MEESDLSSRRRLLHSIIGLPILNSTDAASLLGRSWNPGFPAKEMFDIKGTYINAAYTHPMSKGSFNEVSKYLNSRLQNRKTPVGFDAFERDTVTAQFARLINATTSEIALVPSTMVGENLIVAGLGLPGSSHRVVTDAFHFHGSLHMYGELAKQGLQVTVVKPRENRIHPEDLEAAIQPGTKLVAISLVSASTGFRHNLKQVCEIAHARGAMVYADIIQAAGAVPVDVSDSQVDFCACSTYKWLMGDFGIGFLYVRKDRLPLLKRSVYGYRQIKKFVSHTLPFDMPGNAAFESETKNDMSGYFEVGTFANEGINALRYSLSYLNTVSVGAIHQYRKPMMDFVQDALKSTRFIPLTPDFSSSPILSYSFPNAARLMENKLQAADISISLYENMIRISPSFFNDLSDMKKLVNILRTV